MRVNRKLNRTLRHWLELERKGSETEAEQALGAAFSLLPEEVVPAGFADRVLARTGLIPVPVVGLSRPAVWSLRAVTGLCMVVTAMFLLVIPSYLPAMMGIFHLSRFTGFAIDALVGLVERLGIGLVIWQAISTVGSILSTVLSSPPYLAALAFGALLSIVALRALHEVIDSERSSRYVGSA